MGAVLDKEGVVRRQDLQPYLSEDEAKALYEIKAPVDDPYVRSSIANTRYEAKGVAQPKAPPNDNYILSSMAYDSFQSKELPNNPYLTEDVANGKYLTQTLGDGRYLWRDLLPIGFNQSDENALDYPFLNGSNYMYDNYCFYVKRQDPFDNWDLYYSSFPNDPIGERLTDKFNTNSSQYVC